MKICTKCKLTKELTEFNKTKKYKDGHSCWCRECTKNHGKLYRELNKDKFIEKRKNLDKEKQKEYNKNYYENNKEKFKEYGKNYYQKIKEYATIRNKNYYENNKEKICLQCKKYRELNKDKYKEYRKNYYANNTNKIKQYRELNKEKIKIVSKEYRKTEKRKILNKNYKYLRRALIKNSDVTTEQLLQLQTNSTHCYWCKTLLKNKKTHLDHYIPLSKGGEHTLSNLVVSCAKCNQSKNAKDPIEFANKLGRLL